jgi:hypothetical protein
MGDEKVSPLNGVAPPVWGQWKPGQSGNPEGGRIKKKYKEAIERALTMLGEGDPDKIRTKIAAVHIGRALGGDMAATKELYDREDGKVTQTIAGDDNLPPIRGYSWIPPTLPSTE